MVEIIVKSRIKEYISSNDMNSSEDFFDTLDNKVIDEIKKAEKRAIANNRKTIKDIDLIQMDIERENTFYVKNKIKEYAKTCNVSSSFYNSVNLTIANLVDDAILRAKGNGRKTVQGRDL